MAKLFVTIRIWEETKQKLEKIRLDLISKEKRMVSIAETIEILIKNYMTKWGEKNACIWNERFKRIR